MKVPCVRYHFNVIDSTNTWAKQNVARLCQDTISLVTADEQTAGRGTFNRKWLSPASQNIYASFCLFLEDYSFSLHNIPQVLALTVAELIENCGLQAELKWPNDVLVNGKKIAGILTETVSFSDKIFLILGVGLNVNMTRDELEAVLRLNPSKSATSLYVETGRAFDIESLIQELQTLFMANLVQFKQHGFGAFIGQYRSKLHGLGYKKVNISFRGNDLEGVMHSIQENGTLNVLLDTGEVINVNSGIDSQ